MSFDFCSVITEVYRGKDIYGSGNILSDDCVDLTDVDKFNRYCQTPTLGTDDIQKACAALFTDVKQDENLIYTTFVEQTPTQWTRSQNSIPSGSYQVGQPNLQGIFLDVRSGDETILYYSQINSDNTDLESEIYYGTLKNPGLKKLPAIIVEDSANPDPVLISDNTISFDVTANNGNIFILYFGQTISNDKFLKLYQFDTKTEQYTQVWKHDYKGLGFSPLFPGRLSVSPNGNYVTFIDRSEDPTLDRVVKVRLVDKQRTDYSLGTVTLSGKNPGEMVLLINELQNIFVCHIDLNSKYKWITPDGSVSSEKSSISQLFAKRMSNDGIVYGMSRSQQTSPVFPPPPLLSNVETITQSGAVNNPAFLNTTFSAAALDIDIDTKQLYVMERDSSIIYSTPGFNVSDREIIELGNYAENQEVQFRDIAWSNRDFLFFSFPMLPDNTFRLLETVDIGNYNILKFWVQQKQKIQLCNNGDIVIVQDDVVTHSTNTSDRTVPSQTQLQQNECDVVLNTSETKVSRNGLYSATLGGDNISLNQHIPNEFNLNAYCQTSPLLYTECSKSYKGYCESDENIDTDRCYCYENNEGILAVLFDIEELKKNPLLYAELLPIAPCLSQVCSEFFTENSLAGSYLKTLECGSDITICTSILNISGEGQINGDVLTTLNCGGGIRSCSGGVCPAGSVCDVKTNLCRQLCSSGIQCLSGEKCVMETDENGVSQGICRQGVDDKFSTASLVVIGVLLLLLVVLIIWLILKYKKSK